MEQYEHDYIVRNIQDAHQTQIENILACLIMGDPKTARQICNDLLKIYQNRKEKQSAGHHGNN